jgi:micrococcal nuclease
MAVGSKLFSLLALLTAAQIGVPSPATQTPAAGTSGQSEEHRSQRGELRKVVRVVDGDTIVVSPNEKVRLIGVDTPETSHPRKAVECFGKAAKDFTQSAVEGKTVHLVLDEINRSRRHKDRYGRTLAYVFLENGTMLNRELIRQGYGHAYTRFPFHYLVEFRQIERAARTQGLGLWTSCRIQ